MSQKKIYRLDTSRWFTERVVFLGAGILVLGLSILGIAVNHDFHYAALFVGGMLIFFSLTGYCPMAIAADRLLKK